MIHNVNEYYEKNEKNKNIIPIEEDESYPIYQEIIMKFKEYQNQLEYYVLLFQEKEEKKNMEILERENSKIIREDTSSEFSDYTDNERVQINRVFLNSVVSTRNVMILQSKMTLKEEHDYIKSIFNLKDSFPKSKSKQEILSDFFVNNYKYCLNQKFSIEKISTYLSIIYFVFMFSAMNKKIVKEKVFNLFSDIIDYHSINRPPYSYEIFTTKEKEDIIKFVNDTFFRNYTLFENIFKYNSNIYFHSYDFKEIPTLQFPKVNTHQLDKHYIVEDGKSIEIIHKLYFENTKARHEVVEAKSELEIKKEAELEKLKVFINSFYKSKETTEQDRLNSEQFREEELINMEVTDTQAILDNKIPEIIKDTLDKIDLANKNILKHTDQTLANAKTK